MRDLSIRAQELEMMDDFDVSFEEYLETYRQLQTVNTLTFTYFPTLQFIKRVSKRKDHLDCLKILDIGSGYGDMLRRIARFSRKRNFSVKLVGTDVNPKAIRSAQLATHKEDKIIFIAGDIFDFPFEEEFDIVINSLLMHHLPSNQITEMIRWMCQNAKIAWFINDLQRHVIPYCFIKYFVRLLGMNRMICHDAPLSVARGFSRSEWCNLIQNAGVDISKVTISWYWNFRYGVMYEKTTA